MDFLDDRLDNLVESPEPSDIAKQRDQRPSFDDSADNCLIVDGLAAMVEQLN